MLNKNHKKNWVLRMDKIYMKRAIELAQKGMESNEGGPFGCVIVKGGEIIAEGNNRVTSENDPTAHAEIVAIRRACKALGDFQLTGCDIYTSCEPCPYVPGSHLLGKTRSCFLCGHQARCCKCRF